MNLFDFSNRFPDEAACVKYLKEKREEEGIICAKCGGKKHYWLEAMKLWKCAPAAVGVLPQLAPTDRRCWCSCRWQSSVGNHQQPVGYWQKILPLNAQHVVGIS